MVDKTDLSKISKKLKILAYKFKADLKYHINLKIK